MYYLKLKDKGYRDYFNGVLFKDNPVKRGPSPAMCAWWEAGWKQAEKEDNINKTNTP